MPQSPVSGSRRARITCEQREVKPHVRIGASFATLAWWELVILAIVFSIYHFIVHYGVHWSILSVAQNTASYKADTSRRRKQPTRADEDLLFDADADEDVVWSTLRQRAAAGVRAERDEISGLNTAHAAVPETRRR